MEITKDQARQALCGLPRVRSGDEWLPGYVVYRCPACLGWHTLLDTPILRRMLDWFPDCEVLEPPLVND